MSIIINKESKILIQGITGQIGRHFTKQMIKHDTPIVAGVTPGKGGSNVEGIPVYNFVEEAVKECGANVSLISVPSSFVYQAAIEAIDAGIKVISIYTENVSVHDSIKISEYAKLNEVKLFGPNSAGIISPGEANISDINEEILFKGNIGIVSRSGTLTYEVIDLLKEKKLGISTIVCLGGDPIVGTQHHVVLQEFEKDKDTSAIIYLGEIGGQDEVLAAEVIKKMNKPVYSYIAGLHAPPGKKMGHAGAIIQNESESAKSKQHILKEAGAIPMDVITEITTKLQTV